MFDTKEGQDHRLVFACSWLVLLGDREDESVSKIYSGFVQGTINRLP